MGNQPGKVGDVHGTVRDSGQGTQAGGGGLPARDADDVTASREAAGAAAVSPQQTPRTPRSAARPAAWFRRPHGEEAGRSDSVTSQEAAQLSEDHQATAEDTQSRDAMASNKLKFRKTMGQKKEDGVGAEPAPRKDSVTSQSSAGKRDAGGKGGSVGALVAAISGRVSPGPKGKRKGSGGGNVRSVPGTPKSVPKPVAVTPKTAPKSGSQANSTAKPASSSRSGETSVQKSKPPKPETPTSKTAASPAVGPKTTAARSQGSDVTVRAQTKVKLEPVCQKTPSLRSAPSSPSVRPDKPRTAAKNSEDFLTSRLNALKNAVGARGPKPVTSPKVEPPKTPKFPLKLSDRLPVRSTAARATNTSPAAAESAAHSHTAGHTSPADSAAAKLTTSTVHDCNAAVSRVGDDPVATVTGTGGSSGPGVVTSEASDDCGSIISSVARDGPSPGSERRRRDSGIEGATSTADQLRVNKGSVTGASPASLCVSTAARVRDIAGSDGSACTTASGAAPRAAQPATDRSHLRRAFFSTAAVQPEPEVSLGQPEVRLGQPEVSASRSDLIQTALDALESAAADQAGLFGAAKPEPADCSVTFTASTARTATNQQHPISGRGRGNNGAVDVNNAACPAGPVAVANAAQLAEADRLLQDICGTGLLQGADTPPPGTELLQGADTPPEVVEHLLPCSVTPTATQPLDTQALVTSSSGGGTTLVSSVAMATRPLHAEAVVTTGIVPVGAMATTLTAVQALGGSGSGAVDSSNGSKPLSYAQVVRTGGATPQTTRRGQPANQRAALPASHGPPQTIGHRPLNGSRAHVTNHHIQPTQHPNGGGRFQSLTGRSSSMDSSGDAVTSQDMSHRDVAGSVSSSNEPSSLAINNSVAGALTLPAAENRAFASATDNASVPAIMRTAVPCNANDANKRSSQAAPKIEGALSHSDVADKRLPVPNESHVVNNIPSSESRRSSTESRSSGAGRQAPCVTNTLAVLKPVLPENGPSRTYAGVTAATPPAGQQRRTVPQKMTSSPVHFEQNFAARNGRNARMLTPRSSLSSVSTRSSLSSETHAAEEEAVLMPAVTSSVKPGVRRRGSGQRMRRRPLSVPDGDLLRPDYHVTSRQDSLSSGRNDSPLVVEQVLGFISGASSADDVTTTSSSGPSGVPTSGPPPHTSQRQWPPTAPPVARPHPPWTQPAPARSLPHTWSQPSFHDNQTAVMAEPYVMRQSQTWEQPLSDVTQMPVSMMTSYPPIEVRRCSPLSFPRDPQTHGQVAWPAGLEVSGPGRRTSADDVTGRCKTLPRDRERPGRTKRRRRPHSLARSHEAHLDRAGASSDSDTGPGVQQRRPHRACRSGDNSTGEIPANHKQEDKQAARKQQPHKQRRKQTRAVTSSRDEDSTDCEGDTSGSDVIVDRARTLDSAQARRASGSLRPVVTSSADMTSQEPAVGRHGAGLAAPAVDAAQCSAPAPGGAAAAGPHHNCSSDPCTQAAAADQHAVAMGTVQMPCAQRAAEDTAEIARVSEPASQETPNRNSEAETRIVAQTEDTQGGVETNADMGGELSKRGKSPDVSVNKNEHRSEQNSIITAQIAAQDVTLEDSNSDMTSNVETDAVKIEEQKDSELSNSGLTLNTTAGDTDKAIVDITSQDSFSVANEDSTGNTITHNFTYDVAVAVNTPQNTDVTESNVNTAPSGTAMSSDAVSSSQSDDVKGDLEQTASAASVVAPSGGDLSVISPSSASTSGDEAPGQSGSSEFHSCSDSPRTRVSDVSTPTIIVDAVCDESAPRCADDVTVECDAGAAPRAEEASEWRRPGGCSDVTAAAAGTGGASSPGEQTASQSVAPLSAAETHVHTADPTAGDVTEDAVARDTAAGSAGRIDDNVSVNDAREHSNSRETSPGSDSEATSAVTGGAELTKRGGDKQHSSSSSSSDSDSDSDTDTPRTGQHRASSSESTIEHAATPERTAVTDSAGEGDDTTDKQDTDKSRMNDSIDSLKGFKNDDKIAHVDEHQELEGRRKMSRQWTRIVYEDGLGREVFPRRRKPRTDGRAHRHRTVAVQVREVRESATCTGETGCQQPERRDQGCQCTEECHTQEPDRRVLILPRRDSVTSSSDEDASCYSTLDLSHNFEPDIPEHVDKKFYPRGYTRRNSGLLEGDVTR